MHVRKYENAASVDKIIPAITGIASPAFFDYASGVAVKILSDRLSKANLGDLETFADVPVLGRFRVDLEHPTLDALDLGGAETGLALGADGELVLTVAKLRAVVLAGFSYKRTSFPEVGDSGLLKLTATNGNVRLRIALSNDGAGRAHLAAAAPAEVAFEGLDVEVFNTDLAWLYNLVAALAHSPIQDAITREVAAQVTAKIPAEGNKLAGGIPRVTDVKGLQLNVSLAGDPPGAAAGSRDLEGSARALAAVHAGSAEGVSEGVIEGLEGGKRREAMLVGIIDQSIVNCFTWVLHERGALRLWLAAGDLPDYALYTATWALIVPKLPELFPGNRAMGLQANVSAPPATAVDVKHGVVTSGAATLSFYLAGTGPDSSRQAANAAAGEVQDAADLTRSAARREDRGPHLFTLEVAGELQASKLALEPFGPERPHSYRLAVGMQLVLPALKVRVLHSDVGQVDEGRLQLLASIVAFLVQAQINDGLLRDGFPLPDIPHVQVLSPNITFVPNAVRLDGDVAYVAD
ncbi:hypothetical protein WJX81_003680 [Elliptochloris bilobata]|uniref:Lipid-binding serum glycoprotein C-terminal domain-containing protein n=1 Tax=Elliptochloris bilobata TaxID=381761 RepID=A0AAW1QDC2_9CHLO